MKNRTHVKWHGGKFVRTGYVFICPADKIGESCILQDATVLCGDGTRAERLAARQAHLDSCILIHDGETLDIEGVSYTLKYLGDYSDAFNLTRV